VINKEEPYLIYQFYDNQVKNVKENELFEGQYELFWQEYDELLEKVQSVLDFD
jgi:hypothetical protein